MISRQIQKFSPRFARSKISFFSALRAKLKKLPKLRKTPTYYFHFLFSVFFSAKRGEKIEIAHGAKRGEHFAILRGAKRGENFAILRGAKRGKKNA